MLLLRNGAVERLDTRIENLREVLQGEAVMADEFSEERVTSTQRQERCKANV